MSVRHVTVQRQSAEFLLREALTDIETAAAHRAARPRNRAEARRLLRKAKTQAEKAAGRLDVMLHELET